MTVAFSALHRHLLFRGEDTGLHVLALDDGTMFFNRVSPRLFDRDGKRIMMQEFLAGDYVRVKYLEKGGIKKMDAVQIVEQAADDCPFDPVPRRSRK